MPLQTLWTQSSSPKFPKAQMRAAHSPGVKADGNCDCSCCCTASRTATTTRCIRWSLCGGRSKDRSSSAGASKLDPCRCGCSRSGSCSEATAARQLQSPLKYAFSILFAASTLLSARPVAAPAVASTGSCALSAAVVSVARTVVATTNVAIASDSGGAAKAFR